MCGIAGFVSFNDKIDAPEAVYPMMNALAHRGPDASGTYISHNAAIGHRRLAIIDVENGAQPMTRSVGFETYVISYNGELYNTAELRGELQLLGYKFLTQCDTEVLLDAYIEWGAGCLGRLNGIFAFAIWEQRAARLFLARDRFGVKPLYYCERGNQFIFASEPKGLLAHPRVEPVVGMDGLCEVFALGPSHTPGVGIFDDTYELEPAHYIIAERASMRKRRYWELQSHEHRDSLTVTAERVRCLLREAVTRQLVSDVPLCTLMSGGLDSSAISAIAANQLAFDKGERLSTYSFGYVDNELYFKASKFQPDADDRWVEVMVRDLATKHNVLLTDTDEITAGLFDAVIARDAPGMADIDSSLMAYCGQIKRGHSVAVSGECADEIFGGYPWFTSQAAFDTHGFPWLSNVRSRVSLLHDDIAEAAQPLEYVTRRYFETIERTPRNVGENPRETRRRELFYLNIQWFMGQLLERKDRMSMKHGLEVRVPFADHNLAQYVWNIPWDMKMLNGREKGLLRYALRGILPPSVAERKKSPYPKTHHPAYEAAVRDILTTILYDDASPIHALIKREPLLELMRQKSDYAQTFYGQLMSAPQLYGYMIQVNYWLSQYQIRIQ